MDLRKEFDKLLKQYGHYILLQRTSRKIRCRCFDEVRQEPLNSCSICLGKGWVSKIERHKVRYDSSIAQTSRGTLSTMTPAGAMWTDGKLFFFRHDVDMKVGDMVFEVGWDPKNPHKPTHVIRSYELTDMFEYRSDNGRIEYRAGISKSQATNNNIRNIVVRSLGPIKNYEIVH